MTPFSVEFKPGHSPYSQVVFAVKKALVRGQLRAGQRFPSVRALSQELRINPNTAHKVVAELVREEILEVRPGIGTVIRQDALASVSTDPAPLDSDLEKLVVEAKGIGLQLDVVVEALTRHWKRLSSAPEKKPKPRKRRASR